MIFFRNVTRVFFVLLFFQTSYSFGSEKFVIKKINFIGLQRVSHKSVLSYLPFCVNDVISNDDIKSGIHTLLLTNKFEYVHVSKKKNTLIICVKENPLIFQVVFSGNKILRNDQIEMILSRNKIVSGEIFSKMNVFCAKNNFMSFFRNYGKYEAKIKILKENIGYNRIRLIFIFSEGRFITIKNLRIFGNYAFKEKEILLNFHPYRNISFFKKNYNFPFQRYIFLDDLRRLKNFYLCKGYAKFVIKSIKVSVENSCIFIDINIEEGSRYVFFETKVFVNSTFYFKKIQNIFNFYFKKIYNLESISNIEKNIRNILGNDGYINPYIKINQSIDEKNKIVSLNCKIDIGNQYYVRYIYFIGNSLTKDIVLRKEVQQMEGDVLNLELLEKSKIGLLSHLNCFEQVNYQINYLNNFIDQVDIIFTVKEKNSGNINIGIGFGNENGINFQFNVQQNNWLGTGNSISIHSLKDKLQNYSEIFIHYLNFKKQGIDLSSKLFFDNIEKRKFDHSPYSFKNYGLNTYLGLLIGEKSILNVGIDFSHNNIYRIKPQVLILRYLDSVKKTSKLQTKHYFNKDINLNINDMFLLVGWQYNSLQNKYFPISGTYVNASSKYTIPGFSNLYHKISFDIYKYLPIDRNKNWIFMEKIYLGYSYGLKKRYTPFYDHFYFNGENNVRGFSNTIGPKAIFYKHINKDAQYICYDDRLLLEASKDSIGGNAIAIFNTEIIFPLILLKNEYQDKIRSSLFVDIGTVWNTKKIFLPNSYKKFLDYGKPNFRISSGISIKWYSPVGPLTFSYSKYIKKHEGDKIEPFQFNFGKIW